MKIILFDIDHTLLNTTQFGNNLDSMISIETGLNLEVVRELQDAYIKTLPQTIYYDFNEFVKTLPINAKVAKRVLDKYRNDKDIYTKYSDVDNVIKELKNRRYDIGIFSEGTPHFQYNKLKNLGIEKYLNKELIFITQSKRSDEYIDSLPACIIVDDNIDVCNILAKHKKHKIYHLNINNKAYTPESGNTLNKAITSIENLSQILELL